MDTKILNRRNEIEALKKKVQEAESEKKAHWKVNQQQIDEESLVVIQHLEIFTSMDIEIEGLSTIISQVDRLLSATRI